MQNDDFWKAIGELLRDMRIQNGYSSTLALANALKKPHLQKTFDRIERGQPGQVRIMHRYCDAVGTTLPELALRVIPADGLSGRPVMVARAYAAKTTVQQLVDLALGIPPQVPERGRRQDESEVGPQATAADRRSRGQRHPGR